jgi:hypothetical protein
MRAEVLKAALLPKMNDAEPVIGNAEDEPKHEKAAAAAAAAAAELEVHDAGAPPNEAVNDGSANAGSNKADAA